MLRIHLSDSARDELRRLRRQPGAAPRARDRAEMVLLVAAGWSAPRAAEHLGYCPAAVRSALRLYRAGGAAALAPRRTGPPPDLDRRQRVTGLLRVLLAAERTWTAGQLAEALAGSGVRLGERQVRRYLRLLGAGYRRTVATLAHRQDPAKAAHARRVLGGLKKN